MPSSKGGAQARKQSRKKDDRRKNINDKKKKKFNKRVEIIKARGDVCRISPKQISVIDAIGAETLSVEELTYSTPAEVNLYVSVLCEVVGKGCIRKGNILRRDHKCKRSGCKFELKFAAKMVMIDESGYIKQEQDGGDDEKQLRFVRTKYVDHSCGLWSVRPPTYYTARQLAPLLLKESRNRNLPSVETSIQILKPYIFGDVSRKLVENVRRAGREMMGTGSTADSTELFPSFFEKITEQGHYGVIESRKASVMKKLVLENEKKV